MGVHDEHWCCECRNPLDKKTDQYLQTELVNADEEECKESGMHARAFICMECLDKKKALKKENDKLRKKGNPSFDIQINCASANECVDFKEAEDPSVNCKHVYALGCKLYCARRHPGEVEVGQDKSSVDAKTMKGVSEFFKKSLGSIGGMADVAKCFGLLSPLDETDFLHRVPNIIVPGRHDDPPWLPKPSLILPVEAI